MSPLIEQLSILSVTGIMGDSKVDVAYTAIMYEKWKVRSKFDKYLPRNQFGHDVDLIFYLTEQERHAIELSLEAVLQFAFGFVQERSAKVAA